MKTTQQFTVTLPADMAEQLQQKLRSGAYASASEIMREGIRVLFERDTAIEQWLREEIVPGHQEYLADPSRGIPADQVLDRIKARRAETG